MRCNYGGKLGPNLRVESVAQRGGRGRGAENYTRKGREEKLP